MKPNLRLIMEIWFDFFFVKNKKKLLNEVGSYICKVPFYQYIIYDKKFMIELMSIFI